MALPQTFQRLRYLRRWLGVWLEPDQSEVGLKALGQAGRIKVDGAEERVAGFHPVEVGQEHEWVNAEKLKLKRGDAEVAERSVEVHLLGFE